MTDAASRVESPDRTTRLIPGGAASLAQLTDEELLANTRRLVGRSNQLLAALLLHLAEIEVRGVHRSKRCASLYTYCIYELRFSEDAAARRSAAARLVKQFPALLDAVAGGELHLTRSARRCATCHRVIGRAIGPTTESTRSALPRETCQSGLCRLTYRR